MRLMISVNERQIQQFKNMTLEQRGFNFILFLVSSQGLFSGIMNIAVTTSLLLLKSFELQGLEDLQNAANAIKKPASLLKL